MADSQGERAIFGYLVGLTDLPVLLWRKPSEIPMEVTITLEPYELEFIRVAQENQDLPDYARDALLAVSERFVLNRIEALRPMAASIPGAKATLDTLVAQLEVMYTVGLPSLPLDEPPKDADTIIAILQDTLNDLQAFLRRHQG